MKAKHQLLCVLAAVALAGCAGGPRETQIKPSAEFAPAFPISDASAEAASGSLFVNGAGGNFFGRQRDYRVGDVITVILAETTIATRNTSQTLARESTLTGVDSLRSGIANAATALPAFGKGVSGAVTDITMSGAKINSTGSGAGVQNAGLTGNIAVTVVEVLANGNLVVRGEKILALSEGSEVIQVSGIVRTEDVLPNGTVQSRRLANAQINYRGAGDLASAAEPGWGVRLLHKIWPF